VKIMVVEVDGKVRKGQEEQKNALKEKRKKESAYSLSQR
jgi:hypothetical protein